MPMNRVQFQPGLSLPMFLRRYGTERACEKALMQARWPNGFVCPSCATQAHSTFLRGGTLYWQCSACHHQTSLHAGTVFENTKLPLTTWFLALYLLTQSKTNVAALELTRHLGVCYRTAWRMKHKLMQAMTERESTRRLDGFVQLDDAYLGGERTGGKPGRGSQNKRPFVIAVATDDRGRPGNAVIEPVSGFTKVAITEWAQRRLAPDAEIYSDGLGGFRAVVDCNPAHTVIDAGGGRAATEVAGARWVNIVLSNVKRALDGTYHSFHFFKYAQRYLGEAAWRFNRRFRLDAMVPRLLVASARCRAWTEFKLRNVPAFSCWDSTLIRWILGRPSRRYCTAKTVQRTACMATILRLISWTVLAAAAGAVLTAKEASDPRTWIDGALIGGVMGFTFSNFFVRVDRAVKRDRSEK